MAGLYIKCNAGLKWVNKFLGFFYQQCLLLQRLIISIFACRYQRSIQNPVRHLRWRLLRKQLTAERCELLLQKAPSQMFSQVLNTSLDRHLRNCEICFERLNSIKSQLKVFGLSDGSSNIEERKFKVFQSKEDLLIF